MYKEAIESYKQAIRINPDDAIGSLLISVLPMVRSGMHKEAIES